MSKIVEAKVTWQTTAENKEDSEFELTEILVKVGEKVQEGDPIAIAETEKATIDIYAPVGGLINEVMLETGKTYKYEAILCTIEVA